MPVLWAALGLKLNCHRTAYLGDNLRLKV